MLIITAAIVLPTSTIEIIAFWIRFAGMNIEAAVEVIGAWAGTSVEVVGFWTKATVEVVGLWTAKIIYFLIDVQFFSFCYNCIQWISCIFALRFL